MCRWATHIVNPSLSVTLADGFYSEPIPLIFNRPVEVTPSSATCSGSTEVVSKSKSKSMLQEFWYRHHTCWPLLTCSLFIRS